MFSFTHPFSPHAGVSFEGNYNKFRLPSQASLILIISAVPAAARTATNNGQPPSSKKAFMITIHYASPDSKHFWQRSYYPESFDIQVLTDASDTSKPTDGFRIKWDQGEFAWDSASADGECKDRVWWVLNTKEVRFEATTASGGPISGGERRPWRPHDIRSTPAGPLVHLPLPIQWHVHSVDSQAEFQFEQRDLAPGEFQLDPLDGKGEARVHIEKNWAVSFPKAYIWVQARDHHDATGITIAGGHALPGIQAFLVGYHGSLVPFLSFQPPTSCSVFGLPLGQHSKIDFARRSVQLEIRGWFRRLTVDVRADADSFFDLAAPLKTGHEPGYCAQSFGATVKVEVAQRRWPWSGWEVVEEKRFERGSLEFGGEYYKPHSD